MVLKKNSVVIIGAALFCILSSAFFGITGKPEYPGWTGTLFFILLSLAFREIVHFEGEWVKDGFITLSEKPGIGVEINEEGMKKYATPGVPFFE